MKIVHPFALPLCSWLLFGLTYKTLSPELAQMSHDSLFTIFVISVSATVVLSWFALARELPRFKISTVFCASVSANVLYARGLAVTDERAASAVVVHMLLGFCLLLLIFMLIQWIFSMKAAA